MLAIIHRRGQEGDGILSRHAHRCLDGGSKSRPEISQTRRESSKDARGGAWRGSAPPREALAEGTTLVPLADSSIWEQPAASLIA